MGRGSLVEPDRYWSTPAAHARPSAMAHTIKDCPRPASPTYEDPVHVRGVVVVPGHVAALVQQYPELGHHGVPLRAGEAHGQQDQFGWNLPLGAVDGG